MKIDLTKTPQIIFFILILPISSVLCVYLINLLLRPFLQEWYSPLIDTLGFVSAYSLLYSLFNTKLWQNKIFKKLKVVSFPNLNGRWEGEILTSFNQKSKSIPAVLEIQQTFSQILIELYTAKSKSVSVAASFCPQANGSIELHYEYQNEVNESADKTMHNHSGFAKLKLNGNTLDGSYFNENRHLRGNTGSLNFTFQSHILQRKY